MTAKPIIGHESTKRNEKVSAKAQGRRKTYTTDELATVLGVGRALVYTNLRSGKIPSIRVGNRFVIPQAAIDEWLRNAGQHPASGSDAA